MIPSEFEKLTQWPSNRCLSIGITQDGLPRRAIAVPWATGHSMNMRLPNAYISPADLYNPHLLAKFNTHHIIGLYVFCPLDDYSLLSHFSKVEDLYILKADRIRDLSFTRNMPWFMFYLEGSTDLENLDDLFPCWKKYGLHSYCLGLNKPRVKDVSAVAKSGIVLSELLVWGENSKSERAKWESVPALKRRYYAISKGTKNK